VRNAARQTIPILLALAVAAGGSGLSPAAERSELVARGPKSPIPRSELVARGPKSPIPRIEIPAPMPQVQSPAVRHQVVVVERAMRLTSRPGGGRFVGVVPASSPNYGVPSRAWVLGVSRDGRFGRVPIPYVGRVATGWLRLSGLRTATTRISVTADLSHHRIVVRRGDRVILSAPAATGAAATPTPVGRYVVSDRVPFPGGGMYGTFAFGISGIQTNLPAGWTGGNQLAIHGTNDPSSIGRSASYGCLRVSERILERLRPLLRLGTPVIVRR
jgi:lipoprotein-anchoring transpeptidase ErfK/SrfK